MPRNDLVPILNLMLPTEDVVSLQRVCGRILDIQM